MKACGKDIYAEKVVSARQLAPKLVSLRAQGCIIVFTNGCFDIVHAGHVRYLQAARSQGGCLVVGVNSDASVRCIKGDRRPIIRQQDRLTVLAALACVDFLVLFDDPDPGELIRRLRPDVLVKGADWTEDEIVGADFVKSQGGRVIRVPLVEGLSTSRIIEWICQRYGDRYDGQRDD